MCCMRILHTMLRVGDLQRSIDFLPLVIVFDNSDLAHPYRLEAVYRDGEQVSGDRP